MAAEVVASTAGNGSAAAVGTAAKAFVLAHPLGMAAAGGVLLGMGTYHLLGKAFKKKEAPAEAVVAEATPA